MQANVINSIAIALMMIMMMNMNNAAATDQDLLEMSCTNIYDCLKFTSMAGVTTSCIDGTCQCTTDVGKHVDCIPNDDKLNNIIGGACPCLQPNAECGAHIPICFCKPDYVPSDDGRRCLSNNLVIGEICEFDRQCQKQEPYAICNNETKKCECPKTFIADNNNKCVPHIGDTFTCVDSSECQEFDKNSICSYQKDGNSSICICKDNFVSIANKTRCAPNAYYRQYCIETVQCIQNLGAGGVCQNGDCYCDKDYFVVEEKGLGRCVLKVLYGDYCRTDGDCSPKNSPTIDHSMQCRFTECVCRDGYETHNNINCTKISNGASNIQFKQPLYIIVVYNLLYFVLQQLL